MNRNSPFARKVAYFTTIAVLFVPLSYLSLPAAQTKSGKREPGGVLAELRAEYDLSPAELGEIDPAGESMKLALVGLQGVAANILWDRANEYKKKQEWDKLEATVMQIIKLQPNFKTIWEFQSHNLTYNVSVEFDNYEHRYNWVKKGTEFLIVGTHYNSNEPVLLWNVGWFVGQKIGRADEKVQFRRLFREDKEFHDLFEKNGVYVDKGLGADNKPDNWFVGAEWQQKAQTAVDSLGKPLRKSPLLFYNQLGMCRINGADAMEQEGTLDERAIAAWERAELEWTRYGQRPIPTTFGTIIQLKDLELVNSRSTDELAELERLAPGVREEIKKDKIAALTAEERQAYEAYLANPELDPQAAMLGRQVEYRIDNTNSMEVARRAPVENRQRARALAEAIDSDATLKFRIQNSRNIVNFHYWMARCQSEKEEFCLAARKHLYEAKLAEKASDLKKAREEYQLAFDDWAKVFAAFPTLLDGAEAQELADEVEKYVQVLRKDDIDILPVEIPVLKDIVDKVRQRDQFKELMRRSYERAEKKPDADKPDSEKTEDPGKPESAKPDAEKPGTDKPAEPKPTENKP